jgi:hypothetical protein
MFSTRRGFFLWRRLVAEEAGYGGLQRLAAQKNCGQGTLLARDAPPGDEPCYNEPTAERARRPSAGARQTRFLSGG